MTQRKFKSTVCRPIFRLSLIGLAVVTILNGVAPLPAQANPWQAIRDFFRGDTGGQASGRSRGGATRDETCRINPAVSMPATEDTEFVFPTTTVADLEASPLESVPSTASPAAAATETDDPEAEAASADVQEIVVLAVESQHKTTQANPAFFLYVPFDRSTYNMVLQFDLDVIGTDTSLQSVIGPITLALPEKPGIVQFQLPAETSLAVGETYEWTFRLICQGSPSAPETATSVAALTVENDGAAIAPDSEGDASQADTEVIPLNENEVASSPEETTTESEEPILNIGDIQISSLDTDADDGDSFTATLPTVRQEVYGGIERVDASTELVTALTDSEPSNDYEAYRDNGIWFDMVASLAAHTPSEWAQFLEIFDLEADIDTTPQLLVPLPLDSQ